MLQKSVCVGFYLKRLVLIKSNFSLNPLHHCILNFLNQILTNFQADDGSDDDFGFGAKKKAAPKAKAAPAAKKAAPKKASRGSDSSADEMDFSGIKDYAPAADRPGRARKTVNYNFGVSDSE